MWECPDYFRLGNKDVILMCPQGVEAEGDKYRNIYQSGYMIGDLNFNNLFFDHESFQELDNGFDFYAPQTFVDADGQRILIDGWDYQIQSILQIKRGGHIALLFLEYLPLKMENLSSDLKQLEDLRTNKETALGYANKFKRKLHPYEGKQYEMIIDILENDASEIYFELRSSRSESTLITYNKHENKLTFRSYR